MTSPVMVTRASTFLMGHISSLKCSLRLLCKSRPLMCAAAQPAGAFADFALVFRGHDHGRDTSIRDEEPF